MKLVLKDSSLRSIDTIVSTFSIFYCTSNGGYYDMFSRNGGKRESTGGNSPEILPRNVFAKVLKDENK